MEQLAVCASDAAINAASNQSQTVPPPLRLSSSNPRSACNRCRTRKSKCDSQRPKCTRCRAAAEDCVYPAGSVIVGVPDVQTQLAPSSSSVRKRPRSEIMGTLCNSLDIYNNAQQPIRSTSASAGVDAVNASSPGPSSRLQSNPAHNDNSASVSAGDARTPAWTSPSANESVFLPSHNQLLDRLPSVHDLGGVLRATSYPSYGPSDDATSPGASRVIDTAASISQYDFPQWPAEAHLLVNHFLQYTNAAFPILHGPTIRNQVQKVCSLTREAGASAFDVATVFFMFAVSAMSLPTSKHAALRGRAGGFWSIGLKFYPEARLVQGYQLLQLLHLRLQFCMYAPQYGSVWLESGEAMRTAIDLGIHNEHHASRHVRIPGVLERDMNRRLFWTSYCLDRNLSAALGRPSAIHDDWISAQMPSELDDEYITQTDFLPGSPSPMKQGAIFHIRIRMLQSEIQNKLYTVRAAQEHTPSPEWFAHVTAKIEEWHNSLPEPTGFASIQWYNLNYHMTLTMLFRTCPANATPTYEQTLRAFESSGAIMRTYKEMLRNSRINYHWLAVYHLFMAGVTYLNCLWQADANAWTIVPSYVDALLDIQGCTSVMEALVTITVGTADMRNAFEKIAERVIRRLSSRPSSRPPEKVQETTSHAGSHNNDAVSAPWGASGNLTVSNDLLPPSAWPQMMASAFDSSHRSGSEVDNILGDELENWLRLPIGTLTDLDWSHLGRG